jgi:hypothetical protein
MAKNITRKTVAKAAPAQKVTQPKARKAASPKKVAPKIELPEGYKTMNRTSLTALAKRLGMDVKAKFATRGEGRQALEAFAGIA